jgi:hypothetical protein
VPGRVLAVGVDKQVGINGDHAPRPLYDSSRIRSQPPASMPG